MRNVAWIATGIVAFATGAAAAQSASIAVVDERTTVAAADPQWATDTNLIQVADTSVAESGPRLAASRLLAGVREYPDAIINALKVVAENPDLVRRLAADPGLIDKPGELGASLTSAMKSALEALRPVPDVLQVAAENLDALSELRSLYSAAPDGMTERLKQLRGDYHRTAASAASEWERLLRSDATVFAEYRALLDAYCRAQQEKDEHFPVIYALKPEYYLACPPDAVILEHIAGGSGSGSLFRIADEWYMQNGPEARDAAILREDTSAAASQLLNRVPAAGSVAGMKPEARRALWTGDKNTKGTLGMIPVVLQPLTDQPFEARLAFAVFEHGRLWAGPPVEAPDTETIPGDVATESPCEPQTPAVVQAPAAQPAPVFDPAPVVQPQPAAPSVVIRELPPQGEEEVYVESPVVTETIVAEVPVVDPVVVTEVVDYGYDYDSVYIGGYYGSYYTHSVCAPLWPTYYGVCPVYYAPVYVPSYYSYSCYPRRSWGFSFGFSYSKYGYRPYCRDIYRSYRGTYRTHYGYGGHAYRSSYYGRRDFGRSYGGNYYGATLHGYARSGSGARRQYDSARSQLQRRSSVLGARSFNDLRSSGGRDIRPRSAMRGDSGSRSLFDANRLDTSRSNRARSTPGGIFDRGGRRDAGSLRAPDARGSTRSDVGRDIQRTPRSSSGNSALRDALNRRSLGDSARPNRDSVAGAPRIAPRSTPNSDVKSSPRIAPRGSSNSGNVPRLAPRSSTDRGNAPRIAPRGSSDTGAAPRIAPRGASSNGNAPRISPRSDARPALPRITTPRSSTPGRSPGIRSLSPGGSSSRSPGALRSSPRGGSAPRSLSPGRGGSPLSPRSLGRSAAPGGGSRSMQRAPRSSGGGRSFAAPSRGGSRRP